MMKFYQGLFMHTLNVLKFSHKYICNKNKIGTRYYSQECLRFKYSVVFGLKRTLIHNYSHVCKHLEHFKLFSSLVNFGNEKLELFLKTVNSANIQTKFQLTSNELTQVLLKEKETLEENIQQLKSMKKNEGRYTIYCVDIYSR